MAGVRLSYLVTFPIVRTVDDLGTGRGCRCCAVSNLSKPVRDDVAVCQAQIQTGPSNMADRSTGSGEASGPARKARQRSRLSVRGLVRRVISMPVLHADGRPRAWLRKLLFERSGRPRTKLSFFVHSSDGHPRGLFRKWMTETGYVGAGSEPGPRLWFFMGDTLDWLSQRSHVTGVGRVTTALFAGGLDGANPPLWYPAVEGGNGIRAWQRGKGPPDIAGRGDEGLRKLLDSVPSPKAQPYAGDSVIFTGVVWNDHYVKLFRKLTAEGIGFSLLVHDIIPIQEPSFAQMDHLAEFVAWMGEVARTAQAIFVSCSTVRADVERWCAANGIVPKGPVVVIPFGPSIVPFASSDVQLRAQVSRPFVLSVGTIDTRKNQAFLCRVWGRLLVAIGAERLPMLVLVGRDELGLAATDDVAALQAVDRIALLSDVNDAELDRLYRDCLFTAFPSRMEGYGLPVADSLAYGKLPVVSNLGPFHDYAGDLPFYFDPTDEDDAVSVLRRAIENDEDRAQAEQRIRDWSPGSWAVCADAVWRVLAPHLERQESGERLLASLRIGGDAAGRHAMARQWCDVDTPDVSILIINWNAARLTRMCVDYLHARTSGLSYEILIADNGSRRADLALLHDLGPGVRVFPLGVNRYFGEANNILAEKARGRLLCLLNNDVFVSAGWLERLNEELVVHPEAAAAGPVFLFPDQTVQEAGGTMDASGVPDRQFRGQAASAVISLPSRAVDYISAAALLIHRDRFFAAGGFDLAYEPAYYEDTDLCFKLVALGNSVRLCPAVTVIHLEGYSTDETVLPSARKRALGDLNRAKFLARWGDYLKQRTPASLAAARAQFAAISRDRPIPAKRALIYTPYDLTPGGGERYLLTLAASLTDDYLVTLASPHSYSNLRLRSLGMMFGVDLGSCRIVAEEELKSAPAFDLMVTMGNYVIPPVPGRAARNFYHCQFPFRTSRDQVVEAQRLLEYEAVLVNSEFTRNAMVAKLEKLGLPARPVKVINPPVPQFNGEGGRKRPMILSVGRFFTGGHAKRQDLLIEAFRRLHKRMGGAVELHLAGSSAPAPAHMEYLRELQRGAEDLPVVFHVNCSPEELAGLYRDAAVYWHGTGLGADLENHPELAEHFGIAIVEAMSARCVSFALNAGGVREIISDGEDGFLYDDEGELIAKTHSIFAAPPTERERIGRRASARAEVYTPQRFAAKIRELML